MGIPRVDAAAEMRAARREATAAGLDRVPDTRAARPTFDRTSFRARLRGLTCTREGEAVVTLTIHFPDFERAMSLHAAWEKSLLVEVVREGLVR